MTSVVSCYTEAQVYTQASHKKRIKENLSKRKQANLLAKVCVWLGYVQITVFGEINIANCRVLHAFQYHGLVDFFPAFALNLLK